MVLVYVADHEPELAALLRQTLVAAGHEVVTASDGRALLAQVAARAPDVILLDISMPDLSGWDVRRELLDRHVEAPVIAVMSPGGAGDAAALSSLGFAGCVQKPLAPGEAVSAVDGALKHGYRL